MKDRKSILLFPFHQNKFENFLLLSVNKEILVFLIWAEQMNLKRNFLTATYYSINLFLDAIKGNFVIQLLKKK